VAGGLRNNPVLIVAPTDYRHLSNAVLAVHGKRSICTLLV